ncbi:diphosphomevalonate decarboxylase [Globomyces sp. JEL0801]|nr:diphosphomevalonate decarboxylase [Globomyces sp. JEL0801]
MKFIERFARSVINSLALKEDVSHPVKKPKTHSPKVDEQYKEVTCSAPVNIAVVKYWGKRDTKLILPTNSSLSATLSQNDLQSTTTVRCSKSLKSDLLFLNGKQESVEAKRFQTVLSQARECRKKMEDEDPKLADMSTWKVVIASVNNFPTAAGLASSASGFACLAYCLFQLYELPLSISELSRLARVGSGSACRSLFGGFVKWEMGLKADGSDSLAVQVCDENAWKDMEALILVVSDAKKDVGSTEGMQDTVNSSDLLKHRIESVVPERMKNMEHAIKTHDFDAFAELTMIDSNQFHAVCLDTYPPIFYMNDVSRQIIRFVTAYNKVFLKKDAHGKQRGYRAAYTFDAGPNAVLYLNKKHVAEVIGLVNHFFPTTTSESDKTLYYGRGINYLNDIKTKDIELLIKKIGLKPYPVDSLSRIISTSVGGGPRLLSNEYDSSESLLNLKNEPKH